MAVEMTDFLWQVAGSGYTWGDFDVAFTIQRGKAVALDKGKVRALTDAVPMGGQYTVRQYLPLREFSGLFRTFSLDTEPTERNVQTFASRYGTLGVGTGILLPLSDGRANVGTGETLESWATEIVDMRLAVNLWDAARCGKAVDLERFIHWNQQGVFYENDIRKGFVRSGDGRESKPGTYRFALIAGANTRPDILAHLRSGDLIAPAFWYLQGVINEKLEKHSVTGRLLWDATDREGKQLTVRLVPKNLIGALWLQFAKALDGRDYRQCENCKLWFEVGGSRAARSDKKFCSPTCKAAFHRKERERALDLRKRGYTPARIAKELGKQIDVVKRWV